MKKTESQPRQIKPRMLSVDETAQYIGLAAKTIRNRIGTKAENPFPVKPKHIGGRVLFDVKDLDKYLDALPTT
ncbi:MAG: helix-turn-helix domain-containing protein [Deltaproteobacteria bacterium]